MPLFDCPRRVRWGLGQPSQAPGRLVQQVARDPAASVENSHDRHDALGLSILVNHDIGRHDTDADKRTKRGTRSATFREFLQATVEPVKLRIIAHGDFRARLRGKIAGDGGDIGVRRRGDDEARH